MFTYAKNLMTIYILLLNNGGVPVAGLKVSETRLASSNNTVASVSNTHCGSAYAYECRCIRLTGVFGSFSLIIITTKVKYMQYECYSLDPLDNEDICRCRTVTTGWSILMAWTAFTVFLLAFAGWLFLARILRIEKAKSMI